jgi:hypothetical protein
MECFAVTLEATRTFSDRMQGIERELHQIKAATNEIKATTKEIPPARTWAQIAGNQYSYR